MAIGGKRKRGLDAGAVVAGERGEERGKRIRRRRNFERGKRGGVGCGLDRVTGLGFVAGTTGMLGGVAGVVREVNVGRFQIAVQHRGQPECEQQAGGELAKAAHDATEAEAKGKSRSRKRCNAV